MTPPPSGSEGFVFDAVRFELPLIGLACDLVCLGLIPSRCVSMLVPVPSGAPRWTSAAQRSRLRDRHFAPRPSVSMLGLSRLSVRRTPTPGSSSPRHISPRTLSKVTFHHVRCRVQASSCLASGRSCVSARSRWLQMAEATPLAAGTDTLAAGTVSGDVGDVERSSADPCVPSACSPRGKMPWGVPNSATGPGKLPS